MNGLWFIIYSSLLVIILLGHFPQNHVNLIYGKGFKGLAGLLRESFTPVFTMTQKCKISS